MRKILGFCTLILFVSHVNISIAQEIDTYKHLTEDGKTYIMHPVSAGETLYSIGKKYGVEALLIVNHNPQLVSGLKTGDVLKIPVSRQEQIAPSDLIPDLPQRFVTHDVQRRETLYSISRRYGVSIDDILNFNPGIGQLRRGEKIRIPQWDKTTSGIEVSIQAPVKADGYIIHEVVAGETLFAISRMYGITVQQVQELNPEVSGLKPGMKLKISSQQQTVQPVEKIAQTVTEEFVDHTIVSGETLYSLSRKYKVSAERLVELNPVLDGSFRTGTVIRIPVLPDVPQVDTYLQHLVLQGETLFRISQIYRVTAEELIKWNPFLEYRNVLAGDTLKLVPGLPGLHTIAVEEEIGKAASTECDYLRINMTNRKPVNVVMLLPLLIDANNSMNSDHIISGSDGRIEQNISPDSDRNLRGSRSPQVNFQGNSENFIHFYEGALLALDTLKKQGIIINLKVYDTEQKESRIRHLIATDKLRDADLIIGPVYPNEQKPVSEYAMRNHIPMVSPLSATDEIALTNPWFFQVNTPRNVIDEITAKYVADNYSSSNFIILRTGSQANAQDNELLMMMREQVLRKTNGNQNFRTCDFQKSGLAGIRELVIKGRKNLIILTSGSEAEVSVALSNIHTLAPNYDITVIGNSRFMQFESLNQEYLHDGQFEFLAPYWPDYTKDVTKSFVRKFRNYYKTEPNQFSMQGYDVTYFFAKAVSEFGRDFRNCVHTINPKLVQGNYRFEKLPSGGYVNKGLSVVTFTRDYKVVASDGPVIK
jgi:LysM repeat protein/ABC-type branched-subunit amino acid transport system substrate-binding protein